MKPSDWKLPSEQKPDALSDRAKQAETDLRDSLTLLDLTRRVIDEDYPMQADAIRKFLIPFQPSTKPKASSAPETIAIPVPIKAEKNFVYRIKENGHTIVVRGSRIDEVNTNPEKFEFVCRAPHADGDFSYMCYNEYCRCQQ